jgi:hypothetical protein
LDPDSATTAAEFRQQQQKRPHEEDGEEVEAEVAEVEKQPKKKKSKKERRPKALKKVVAAVNGDTDAAEKSTPAKFSATSPAQKKGKGKSSVAAAAAAAVAPESEVATPAPATASDNDNDDDEMEDAGEPIQINGFADLAEQSSPADTPAPTTPAPATQKPPKPTLSPTARAEQRARLAARIEALRASRKADNIDGSSARTRQELMEARRKKEALRKERKKAARLVAKLSTDEGGVPSTPSSATNTNPTPNPVTAVKNFSFGRVMFDDGNQLDASLTDFKKEKRRTGPRDILGQLKHTEAKKRRVENMSEEKKVVVVEKEKWSKALKQATGEKVKDDEKLLKKALKRQEATKRKSSTEWYTHFLIDTIYHCTNSIIRNERLAGQAKAKSLRVKKREENIQARKDQKKAGKSGKKGGVKKGGKPGGKKGGKKASRPGFEGGMKLSGKGIPNGKGKK